MRERLEREGLPPLGFHVFMGERIKRPRSTALEMPRRVAPRASRSWFASRLTESSRLAFSS